MGQINNILGNTLLETGFFPPCRATTTASITLSGLQTIDGVVLASGDRVLVKNQTNQTTNGIYAASSGNWPRTTDAASNTQYFEGMGVVVANGATRAGTMWLCTSTDDPVVIGTSLLTFALQTNVSISSQQLIDTRALAAAIIIPSSVNFLRTAGYTTIGDYGGALYKKASGTTTGGFQSADGQWWQLAEVILNPRMLGAAGDGTTNDNAAFTNALSILAARGGGTLFVPAGSYSLPSGITIGDSIRLVGASRGSTFLTSHNTDVSVVTLSGTRAGLHDVWILGKGATGDTGTFGAVQHALLITGNECVVRDVNVWGGNAAMSSSCSDAFFENIYANLGYGTALIVTTGSNWYKRCKFDQSATGVSVTSSQPYSAWASLHAYTAGTVAVVGGYAIECITSGTSGSVAPTLKNYGQNIADGTVVWQLLAPDGFNGILLTTGSLENRLEQCDFSGSFRNSVVFFESLGVLQMAQCVASGGISLQRGLWADIQGCTLGADVNIASGFSGKTRIQGNLATGAITIGVTANENNFIVKDNFLPGGSITTTGTSDHYVISGNVGATVTDGASGLNKSVTGNVA